MRARSKPIFTIRCALREDGAAWLSRYGASARLIARHGGPLASSLTSHALVNFAYVWTRKARRISRYSDGSFNVLYTATKAHVAKAERIHWLIEIVFKRSKRKALPALMTYTCQVTGIYLDFMKDWKARRQIVHPKKYAFCHEIARTSIDRGASHIVVPSARKMGGCCVPVFDKKHATISKALEGFKVAWDAKRKEAYIPKGARRTYIKIDNVFRLSK